MDSHSRRDRSIEELAREQGVAAPQKLDEVMGAAADLWDGEEDFERFLDGIHERRGPTRQRIGDGA